MATTQNTVLNEIRSVLAQRLTEQVLFIRDEKLVSPCYVFSVNGETSLTSLMNCGTGVYRLQFTVDIYGEDDEHSELMYGSLITLLDDTYFKTCMLETCTEIDISLYIDRTTVASQKRIVITVIYVK